MNPLKLLAVLSIVSLAAGIPMVVTSLVYGPILSYNGSMPEYEIRVIQGFLGVVLINMVAGIALIIVGIAGLLACFSKLGKAA